ncbi:calcium-binding protein [Gloeobacter violaceus]|uniref:Gll2960 protein n=1 Tax=Gloeobacter violaceus (strain ATCC 29082 / PCC 7421) TaxID=251221 RepID=Q7NCL8_GLOVI|nr:calcium-binding protein [Gloeobacter violaceus]BAC90901.1 gll2960 [Gloeobacter violaceus PCC 7421]
MPDTPLDEEREHRITMQIVVDAYGPEEQAMGWYCYLENTLQFPFSAWYVDRRPRTGGDTKREVQVIGLADSEKCEAEIYVLIDWEGDELPVPLRSLEPFTPDEKTREAVEDWHYWMNRGYGFAEQGDEDY